MLTFLFLILSSEDSFPEKILSVKIIILDWWLSCLNISLLNIKSRVLHGLYDYYHLFYISNMQNST
jgi:hypothetical protein